MDGCANECHDRAACVRPRKVRKLALGGGSICCPFSTAEKEVEDVKWRLARRRHHQRWRLHYNPRLLSCLLTAAFLLLPAAFFLLHLLLHLHLHLLLLLQYKTQIRFGCRLMRNLYAAQTVGHFFCFLFSPPAPAPPSRFRFRLGFVWPRQLALEEITIKLNGIQSYTTLALCRAYTGN